MINYQMKYYKIREETMITVNPRDYTVRYYCGSFHWFNLTTGDEEIIYLKKESFKFNKNTMEIETKILVREEDRDPEWCDFTLYSENIIGFYKIENDFTRVITSAGEFDIKMKYLELKKIKIVEFNQKSFIQFN